MKGAVEEVELAEVVAAAEAAVVEVEVEAEEEPLAAAAEQLETVEHSEFVQEPAAEVEEVVGVGVVEVGVAAPSPPELAGEFLPIEKVERETAELEAVDTVQMAVPESRQESAPAEMADPKRSAD